MKGILSLLVVVATLAIACATVAQPPQRDSKGARTERKYDFTLVRKEDGTSSWGSWNGTDAERFKKMGPGLYVRKDGATYRITDPEILRKADDAMAGFKKASERLKAQRHAGKDDAKVKEMEQRMRARGEAQRKLGEQMREYGSKMRDAKDSAEREKIAAKMRELGEQMRAASKDHADEHHMVEFGKQMAEFGRQMSAAAHEAGDKICDLIDQAFAKGLAKKI